MLKNKKRKKGGDKEDSTLKVLDYLQAEVPGLEKEDDEDDGDLSISTPTPMWNKRKPRRRMIT